MSKSKLKSKSKSLFKSLLKRAREREREIAEHEMFHSVVPSSHMTFMRDLSWTSGALELFVEIRSIIHAGRKSITNYRASECKHRFGTQMRRRRDSDRKSSASIYVQDEGREWICAESPAESFMNKGRAKRGDWAAIRCTHPIHPFTSAGALSLRSTKLIPDQPYPYRPLSVSLATHRGRRQGSRRRTVAASVPSSCAVLALRRSRGGSDPSWRSPTQAP